MTGAARSAEGASRWEPVIGLEVHVLLATRSKLFCACASLAGAPPNTLVCPYCTGQPGTLPVLNREALRLGALGGLALGCTIDPITQFDRKHYTYPDLPKGYQITQVQRPLGRDGRFAFSGRDGAPIEVGIHRAHLEEDAGRSVHPGPDEVLVDLNRAGAPLLEVVTSPDLHAPEEAADLLRQLRRLLRHAGVSACDMEHGGFRCDVNVSVRPSGTRELGARTEIKNLNSFRWVEAALRAEIARQVARRERGEEVVVETRAFDPETSTTSVLRSKEGSDDYRYLHEPDLPPVEIDPSWIQSLSAALPEPPVEREARFRDELGLSPADAEALVADRDVADFFEAACALTGRPRETASWVRTVLLPRRDEHGGTPDALAITPEQLAEVVALVVDGQLSTQAGRRLVDAIVERPGAVAGELAAELELGQVSDAGALAEVVESVVAAEPDLVRRYRAGQRQVLEALLGLAMRATGGRGDARRLRELLEQTLASGG